MHQSRWDWLRKQRPNRAERPGVRRPSGDLPHADEENRTDFLNFFLDEDGRGVERGKLFYLFDDEPLHLLKLIYLVPSLFHGFNIFELLCLS